LRDGWGLSSLWLYDALVTGLKLKRLLA